MFSTKLLFLQPLKFLLHTYCECPPTDFANFKHLMDVKTRQQIGIIQILHNEWFVKMLSSVKSKFVYAHLNLDAIRIPKYS